LSKMMLVELIHMMYQMIPENQEFQLIILITLKDFLQRIQMIISTILDP